MAVCKIYDIVSRHQSEVVFNTRRGENSRSPPKPIEHFHLTSLIKLTDAAIVNWMLNVLSQGESKLLVWNV